SSVQISEIVSFGPERLPSGPNVADSDAIIIVEGRQDVLNLLRSGIKNAIAVEGTNVPKTVQELSKEKGVTAFVDGDRGGDLILRELLQVAEVDFIARAPRGREVEELTQKQIMKALRNKIPGEQFIEMYGLSGQVYKPEEERPEMPPLEERGPRPEQRPAMPVEPIPAPMASKEPMPPPPSAPRAMTPRLEKYREMLIEIGGSSKAKILADDDSLTAEVPVRSLVETLRSNREAKAVVFDGIITQRILDIASEIGIKSVVGMKMGTITNQPPGIEVFTKGDFVPT
ncbi:MAG: toprim domain-containing protein, partial [Candidatus Thermoplasmatota archaeon]